MNRYPVVHELKTVSPHFEAVRMKQKTFEVRNNDRDFQRNDILILKHYEDGNFTCTVPIVAKVAYILDDPNFVKDGMVILGIEVLS